MVYFSLTIGKWWFSVQRNGVYFSHHHCNGLHMVNIPWFSFIAEHADFTEAMESSLWGPSDLDELL